MSLELIVEDLRATAASTEMSIDREAYLAAGRDPLNPILYAGNREAPVAFFARDLGREEVALGQPLIGGAGRRVRRAVYRFLFNREPAAGDKLLPEALEHILLTNTVPYKPVGNKAYPPRVRERFRPSIAAFLAGCWQGAYVITLGTEAFHWFAPYVEPGELEAFWRRPDRYEAQIGCRIASDTGGRTIRKTLTIAPLPHPSPLNRAYLEQFPSLLEIRLRSSPLEPQKPR